MTDQMPDDLPVYSGASRARPRLVRSSSRSSTALLQDYRKRKEPTVLTHTTSNLVRHTARKSALLAVILCGALAGAALAQSTSNPGILPPNSKPYGHTYGQWSAQHWQ